VVVPVRWTRPTARLASASDGRRALELDVRDVKRGETLLVRRRETGKASTSIHVFLSVGDPAKQKDDPGVIQAVTATAGAPGVTRLRVELEGAVDRVRGGPALRRRVAGPRGHPRRRAPGPMSP
jgi:hypothetical protein